MNGYLVWSQEGTANGICGHQLIPQAAGSAPAIGYLTSQALTKSLRSLALTERPALAYFEFDSDEQSLKMSY